MLWWEYMDANLYKFFISRNYIFLSNITFYPDFFKIFKKKTLQNKMYISAAS